MLNSKNNSNVIAIIPARHASSRFPGKPLAMINGKTMLRTVYDNIAESKIISKVLIATDDDRIAQECIKYDMNYVMTPSDLQSGTDRIYEAVKRADLKPDFILNIQGDEPLLTHYLADDLTENFILSNADVGTVIKKIQSNEELFSDANVKVVLDNNNFAMYFSRSVIPYLRDLPKSEWLNNHKFYKHIGVYIYTYESLSKFAMLTPSVLEKSENLEQLRLLQNGFTYYCLETNASLFGVDFPDDIIIVENIIKKQNEK
jgi:3-deoxy-manno-octulosonate cytidylyltransferase (CMP-KDO synthetase)